MSSRRSLLTLALGACLLSGAAQSQIASEQLGTASLLRPTTDITLSGDVTISRLEVPRHVTVWLSSDLTLRATGDIVIEGAMAALPGAHVNGDGIDLTLVSHGSITLDGVLAVGNGLAGDAPGVAGGHGGDLKLLSPRILSARHLVAGAGGAGGPGADGGDGGDVLTYGAVVPTGSLAVQGALVRVMGGQGGAGGAGSTTPDGSGAPGGDGGDGGDGTPGVPGNDGLDIILTNPADDGVSGGPCTAGTPGAVGSLAVGGNGGPGGPGGDAQTADGNGGVGGVGGKGGEALGADGGDGGDSGDCCFVPNVGADGAKGGNGGSGFGGNGGTGGNGGNGGGAGSGGDGGAGGAGGNGDAGDGGDAGNGADGFPAGNAGAVGIAGTGGGGAGGVGGSPGFGGLGDGLTGFPGIAGSGTNGVGGSAGSAGALCNPSVTWTNTSFGLAGTAGQVPNLVGLGPLTPLTVNNISLFDALPNTTAGLFAGFSPLLFPFKGGWIVPAPDLLVTLPTDLNGDVSLPFFLPPAVPPGFVFHMQFWVQDPGGPQGFSASNGLRARTQ